MKSSSSSGAVTIKQVARRAGVSTATVSRVLNGSAPVREETRSRVLEAARRLDYVPDQAARSLITRRTRTIGVILPEVHGAYFSEVVRGADAVARQAGYHLLLSGFHSDERDLASILRTTRGRVDGLIVMLPHAGGRPLASWAGEPVPVVFLNAGDDGTAHDVIRIDNAGGARQVLEHLWSLGHRRLAVVTGPAGNIDAAERLRGFRKAFEERGGDPRDLVEVAGDFSEQSGHAAGASIVALEPRPTAVFATNDSMAVGVLAAADESGVEVPEALSLVGFDDIPMARYLNPPLTSVAACMAEVGQRAVQRLLSVVGTAGLDAFVDVLPARLVVRASTAGPAGRDRSSE